MIEELSLPELADIPSFRKVEGDGVSIRRVCFVCTGNTCRSPMAAAIYNFLNQDKPTHAISRGLAVNEGEPIAKNAIEALGRQGILPTPKNDYAAHRAMKMTDEVADTADVIYALSSAHYMALCMAYPQHISKISLLGEIADPYGGPVELYEKTLQDIREALHE